MNGRPGNPDSGMRINLLVSRTQQPHFDNTRIVQIEKPVNGLGFNIVGGEVDHQGIISRIGKAFLSLTSCGWFQSFSQLKISKPTKWCKIASCVNWLVYHR